MLIKGAVIRDNYNQGKVIDVENIREKQFSNKDDFSVLLFALILLMVTAICQLKRSERQGTPHKRIIFQTSRFIEQRKESL